MRYIVALDQGTTSSRAAVFDQTGRLVGASSIEFPQIYPKPGWVEHDPKDILTSQIDALRAAVAAAKVEPAQIAAIGIANQRETTLLWDRATGEPIHNAIVWQCRRTAKLVERLKRDGLGNIIRDKTGLIPDAYFSGTKLQWLLDEIPQARERAQRGELCFGTVDSFLTHHLTRERPHVTDATNAARTMLYNIHTQEWDEQLLRAMNIPAPLLPSVVDTASIVGTLRKDILGHEILIASLAGDQHASLFGQSCFAPGMVKNTYGTGCFMLMNTGSQPIKSKHNLLTTVAWRIGGKQVYALEGSVFMAGAIIKWLRDEMGLIETAAETDALARALASNENVYLVPAFAGLGAPYWDMYGRGLIIGLTRGTGRKHIVRAALESIAYQTRDVLDAMALDSGLTPSLLRVDGGASANDFLMQFQSDILSCAVMRPRMVEVTALGAAMFAGRCVGIWNDAQLKALAGEAVRFQPRMSEEERLRAYGGWQRAVKRSMGWLSE